MTPTAETQFGSDAAAREATPGAYGKLRKVWLGVLLASMSLMLPMLYSYSGPTQNQDNFVACRSNIKLLAAALERYAGSHDGHYPHRLAQLIPDNLSRMPQCPAAGADTYSGGYFVSDDLRSYRLECAGHHHGKTSPNVTGQAPSRKQHH